MTRNRPVGGSLCQEGVHTFRVVTGLAAAVLLLIGVAASAATYSVTNTNDSGAGSLRQAILDANANAGADVISFTIAGSGPFTISPTSALPTITEAVTIDGTTQSGASANSSAFGAAINAVLEIAVDGTSAGAVDGLTVSNHAGTVIRGLNVRNFEGNGIVLTGTGGAHTVAGCFIGTNVDGSAAAANGENGIYVDNVSNTIGGSLAADRNLISGNGPDNVFAGIYMTGPGAINNVVYGNYIGTSASGTSAIGNSPQFGYGVLIVQGASNNTIGSSSSPGNVISGNGGGISIQGGSSDYSTGNTIVGNRIGTTAAGTAALGNLYQGIGGIAYADNTMIGGTTVGARNVISANQNYGGIVIGGSSSGTTTIQGNYIGTDITGTAAIPNDGNGVRYTDTGPANTVIVGGTDPGAGNVIAYNNDHGVSIEGGFGTPTGNRVLGNSIHDNLLLGIDLGDDGVTANDACDADTGENDLQNYPVLTAVTTAPGQVRVVGSLNSVASSTYRVEFFANAACDGSGNGEGERFLGFSTVATDGSCNGSFDVMLPATVAVGEVVTATATNAGNSTSEFSACVAAAAGTANAIPSLGAIGLTLLAMLLALGGALAVRRT